MAISPAGKGDVDSSGSSDLMVRIVGGVIGAVVLFFIAKWIIGFVFTIVQLAIFVGIVVAVIWAIGQFTGDD